MAEIFYRIENLRKTFGEAEVLKSVTFQLSERDVFALIGPSGAGKTSSSALPLPGRSRPIRISFCSTNPPQRSTPNASRKSRDFSSFSRAKAAR